MTIGRTQMGTQLQGNRKMKKYQAGMGVESSLRPKMRPEDMEKMAAMKKTRPKARPTKKMPPKSIGGGMTDGTRGPAPMRPDMSGAEGMPKMKKGGGVKKMMSGGGVSGVYGKGAMEKELEAKKAMGGAEGMPKMKKGGKVRGYGMARGGKVCKMR